MLHVAQISFHVDSQRRAPEQLLIDWHTVADLARAAASAGLRVTVIQASMREARFTRDGAEYCFIAPHAEGSPLTGSARFAALLEELAPDVLHVQGLGFAREVVELRGLAPCTPILLQDRANRPPRFWRRGRWRRQASVVNGVLFCAREQAEPFIRAGVLGTNTPIFEMPGSIPPFAPGDRSAARAATGLHGDPAVLWVAHLNANKDPLTVLDAISIVARDLPDVRLWCCFGTAPLLSEVQARIAASAELRNRVYLLGRVPRDRVRQLMQAADLFVLASHREGGSFSLMEALACGLPAAVSDIASSRALLGGERSGAGALWPRGDAVALADAIRRLAAQPREPLRARARAQFDVELSSAAVGRKLASVYRVVARAGAGVLGATPAGTVVP
jgi:glycosyltransferase involved in cell wall biosynthesis